jgi:hypothetical protein
MKRMFCVCVCVKLKQSFPVDMLIVFQLDSANGPGSFIIYYHFVESKYRIINSELLEIR